eukprot:1523783-Pyramimonas_sp.AAC.2
MPPPERCICKLCHGVIDAGAPRANIHLHAGELAEDRKAQLLSQVAAVTRTIGATFVICAD